MTVVFPNSQSIFDLEQHYSCYAHLHGLADRQLHQQTVLGAVKNTEQSYRCHYTNYRVCVITAKRKREEQKHAGQIDYYLVD
jgi:hypothetical protein